VRNIAHGYLDAIAVLAKFAGSIKHDHCNDRCHADKKQREFPVHKQQETEQSQQENALAQDHRQGITDGGGRAMPISELIWGLSNFVDRPIIDRTNLRGEFDIDITYQFELPPGGGTAPWTAGAPALFTAVQDQLGLKLEATRAPFEVVIIDSISRPTEN
jgi:uncharacterized protein (TIGR03435 family)